jgi:hypothetical protein
MALGGNFQPWCIKIAGGLDDTDREKLASFHQWLYALRTLALVKLGDSLKSKPAVKPIVASSDSLSFPMPNIQVLPKETPSIMELVAETLLICAMAKPVATGEDAVWCQAIFLILAFAADLKYEESQINEMVTGLKLAKGAHEVMNTILGKEEITQIGRLRVLKSLLGIFDMQQVEAGGFGTKSNLASSFK